MKRHLFLISSTVNNDPGKLNDNIATIAETAKSIFLKVSNARIAIVEFSENELDENAIGSLREVSNYIVNLTIDPDIKRINQEKHNPVFSELNAFDRALTILEEADILKEVDRVHFIKGGSRLDDNFKIEVYEQIDDRIVLSAPSTGTIDPISHQYDHRLWSWPTKLISRIRTYHRSAIAELSYRLDKGTSVDISHLLYYLLPLQDCISVPNLGVSDITETIVHNPNAPYKLKFYFTGIGDQLSTTPIPEILFKRTGRRSVIDDERIWAFKHNPYVDFMSEAESRGLPTIHLAPDSRMQEQREKYYNTTNLLTSNGQADFMSVVMGINDAPLRHPRLYIHEDVEIKPTKIVVHTTGSDRTKLNEPAIRNVMGEDDVRIMSDEVIEAILKNYKYFEIIQVGGIDDKPLGGHSIDLRGKLDYWEVAKEIASASRFIGVNSGPMHIAHCYPRVDKRIALMEFPKETLLKYQPCDIRNWLFSWLDPSSIYFNKTTEDIGVTYSYTKI